MSQEKILIITCEYPPFPGGIGTYSGEIASAMSKQGSDVSVVAPEYQNIEHDFPKSIRHYLYFKHHSINVFSALRLVKLLFFSPKNTIILCSDIRSVIVTWLLKSVHRMPYRVMVHGSEASKLSGGLLSGGIARRAYLGASLIAYNSEATKAIFRSNIDPKAPEVVTYLGVDPMWKVDPPSDGFEHKELLAVRADELVFCSVGRLEARKGQLDTIRALAYARDNLGIRDPIYVVAGRTEDHDYEKSLSLAAEQFSIRLIMTGRLSTDDIKRLYDRSAAHLLFAKELPGKIEGFGLVLLEAASRRCPSISTRVGGVPEVLGEAGIVVEKEDVAGFAAAVRTLAIDADTRESLASAAEQRTSEFSWMACALKTFPECA